jgi:hypothetical protein
MKIRFRTLTILLALVGVSSVAQAAPIPTLFGTGLSPGGLALASGAADPHYTLVLAPPGVPFPASPLVVGPVLDPAWAPNTPTSQWINPTGTGAFVEGGDYWYETTFDLTGFVASTTSITGAWAADDAGMSISLNGVPMAGTSTGVGVGSYAGLHLFLIEGAGLPWLPGINTLLFKTSNTGPLAPPFTGPTGIQVKIIDADADLVPVPAAAWLFGSGLLALGGLRFKKAPRSPG